jgi:hypothetical protein
MEESVLSEITEWKQLLNGFWVHQIRVCFDHLFILSKMSETTSRLGYQIVMENR